MSDSGWCLVTRKKPSRPKPKPKVEVKPEPPPQPAQVFVTAQHKSQSESNELTKKYGAATNKRSVTTLNTAKLDRETEELHHEKISSDISKLIQLHRQAKGLSQKELANQMNEKAQVINEYESGRAIPNQTILDKLERTLGVKLRGRDKGKPLKRPGKGK